MLLMQMNLQEYSVLTSKEPNKQGHHHSLVSISQGLVLLCDQRRTGSWKWDGRANICGHDREVLRLTAVEEKMYNAERSLAASRTG